MTLAWRDYDDSMKRHREATVLPPLGLFCLLLQFSLQQVRTGYRTQHDLIVARAGALLEPPDTAFLQGPFGFVASHQRSRDAPERRLMSDYNNSFRDAARPLCGIEHGLSAGARCQFLHYAIPVAERLHRLDRARGRTDEEQRVVVQPAFQPLRRGLRLFYAARRQLAHEIARGLVFCFGVAPENEVHRMSPLGCLSLSISTGRGGKRAMASGLTRH